jgi:hypothetical protein
MTGFDPGHFLHCMCAQSAITTTMLEGSSLLQANCHYQFPERALHQQYFIPVCVSELPRRQIWIIMAVFMSSQRVLCRSGASRPRCLQGQQHRYCVHSVAPPTSHLTSTKASRSSVFFQVGG